MAHTGQEKSEFRCAKCHKLLAITNGETEVVCSRCKALNKYNPVTKEVTYKLRGGVGNRVTSSGVTFSR